MKNLFSSNNRTDLRPAKYNDHPFSYLDMSARAEASDIRNFLEEAFNNYPDDESEELKKRLQSTNVDHYKAAAYELVLHEFFIRIGYDVSVHPEIKNSSKRPDFVVSSPKGWSFYLEAIHTNELSNERRILENQKNNLYDEINNKFSGACAFLSISIIKQSKNNFCRSTLLNDIQSNLDRLQTTPDIQIYWKWESEKNDWCIELELSKCNQVPNRFIACIFPYPPTRVDVPKIINKAFRKKSTKYGKLQHPLILAINIDAPVLRGIDEMEGLFGKERFIDTNNGIQFAGRQKNGAWYGPNGCINTRVSGAWLFDDLTP